MIVLKCMTVEVQCIKNLRHFEACSYYRLDNFKMFLSWKSSLLVKRKKTEE